jgi:Ser/Thr protein kinase RdoA (MazF antagonist)
LVTAIREHTKDGEQLVDFMLRVFRGEVPSAKLRDQMDAVSWLADRGFGRPVQGLNVETFEIDLTRLSDEQLERISRGEHPAVVVGIPGQG